MARTLDEAIVHTREVITTNKFLLKNKPMTGDEIAYCENRIKEHEQLAEWLEELELLREEKKEFQIIARDNYEMGYNKAIDDFMSLVNKKARCGNLDVGDYHDVTSEIVSILGEISEQLKAGISQEKDTVSSSDDIEI